MDYKKTKLEINNNKKGWGKERGSEFLREVIFFSFFQESRMRQRL